MCYQNTRFGYTPSLLLADDRSALLNDDRDLLLDPARPHFRTIVRAANHLEEIHAVLARAKPSFARQRAYLFMQAR